MKRDTPSDSQLVHQVLQGDPEAFGEIVRRYQDAVYATALHCTHHFADAQDVAQEAFLAAYKSLAKLRDPSKLASWLRTVTRYTYHHWQRRQPKTEALQEDSMETIRIPESSRPDRIVEQQELQQRVLAAIASLPDPLEEVVTLHYIDGFSYQDIAGYLSLPTTTVKGRLQMGRKRLREEFMDMVEGTLKQHRPDERFSESVLEAIVARAKRADQENAYEELLQACNEALEVAEHLEDTEAIKRMRLDVQRWRANGLAHWFGKPDEAASSWEEAARLADELDRKDEQARWLLMAGVTHWQNGRYEAMKPYAQRAKAIYQQLGDLSNQAICDALIDLGEMLPEGWQRVEEPGVTSSGYAVYVFPLRRSDEAILWDWEDHPRQKPSPTHHLISIQLRRGYQAFGPDMTFGSLTQPAKWMELPLSVGQAWEGEIDTYESGEMLPARTAVASLTDTVVTPAGRFEDCLRLETHILEPEDAEMSDAMRVFRRRCRAGLRLLWFAPGVGLVKAYHENEDSDCRIRLLTEHSVTADNGDYFPLHPGNTWRYQWHVNWCGLLVTEQCRVAGCREDTFYLTSSSYSEPLDERGQLDYFEHLLSLERASQNPRGEAQILNRLHNVHACLGHEKQAMHFWEQQESLCAELGDAKLHYALLMRISDEGHPHERVQASCERAAEIARTLGDRRREARPWSWLADAALRWKDYTLAADAAQKAVAILEEIDEGEDLAGNLAALDVSRTILHASDAGQNVGTSRTVLYLEQEEELILHGGGGISPLYKQNRIQPPSFGFLADVPLLKEPHEVGASWVVHDRARTIKQQITDTDATVEVPAGRFEHCLLVQAEIRHRADTKGSPEADAIGEQKRGYQEGTLQAGYARRQGIVQMDYRHHNGQRTLVQLTKAEIQGTDDPYLPIQPGNLWYYDWTNEKDELLVHEMCRVLPRRGGRLYIAVSAYAVHGDYAG